MRCSGKQFFFGCCILGLIIMVTFLTSGCGSPEVSSGTISAKQFVPAHDTHWLMPMQTGSTCFKSGASNICTPIYTYIPETTHHNDAWKIQLEDPDGHHQWWTTDETTYHHLKVGETWNEKANDG